MLMLLPTALAGLAHSQHLLWPALAVLLLVLGAWRLWWSTPARRPATQSQQESPGARVLSRQLSAFSLQQSLCTSSSRRQGGRARKGVPLPLPPVGKLLKRVFNTQPPGQNAVPILGRHRGNSRSSVDSAMLAPLASEGGPSRAAQRVSMGSSPFAGGGDGSALPSRRWAPEMARIPSGQDLQALQAGSNDASREALSPQSKLQRSLSKAASMRGSRQLGRCASIAFPPLTGTGAVDCAGNDATDPLMRPDISVAVPEVHLLQLGALLGEHSAQAALRQQQQQGANCFAGPGPSTFLGPTDDAAQYADGWEPLAEEHRAGLHYWAWRRYLRKGLYMYKSRTVFEGGVTASQLAAFNFDWRFKQVSDDGCAEMKPMLPPGCSVGGGRCPGPDVGASLFLAAAATCPDPAGALDSPLTSTDANTAACAPCGASTLAGASSFSSTASAPAGGNVGTNSGGGGGGGLGMHTSGYGGLLSFGSGGPFSGNTGSGAGVSGGGKFVDGTGSGNRVMERNLSGASAASSSYRADAGGEGGGASAGPVRSLEEELESRTFGQSCYLYARIRFPPPMAARQYIYARRVWLRPEDGGCYVISHGTFDHPCPPPFNGRAVNVEDMVSGFVVRSAHGIYDRESPAAEMVSLYYEDSHVSPGMVNLGVRKALWPIVQKMNDALRVYMTCTGEAVPPNDTKLHKAAAQAGVRSDLALARHARVLQRYGNGNAGGSGTASSVAGAPPSAAAGTGTAASAAAAAAGAGAVASTTAAGAGASSMFGGAQSGAQSVAVSSTGAAAAAAAAAAPAGGATAADDTAGAAEEEPEMDEEEAAILRAFDEGTLLPRQSGRSRLLPGLYRTYVGVCSALAAFAHGVLYTARAVLALQLAVNRACLSGLRSIVLSNRYAELCAWLAKLAASSGEAAGIVSGDAASSDKRSDKQGVVTGSGVAGGEKRGGTLLGWLLGGKARGDEASLGDVRPKLASHPLQAQSLKSFKSHPLRAASFGSLRTSMDTGADPLTDTTNEDEVHAGGAARALCARRQRTFDEAGEQGVGVGVGAQQGQPKRGGGRQMRHIERRIIAKGATFALRAAALPLMHRALQAACNAQGDGVGLGGGAGRAGRQQQQQQQRWSEEAEEDPDAAAQRAKRRAQWLSAVAKSKSGRPVARSSSSGRGAGGSANSSGNGRATGNGSGGVQSGGGVAGLPPSGLAGRDSGGRAEKGAGSGGDEESSEELVAPKRTRVHTAISEQQQQQQVSGSGARSLRGSPMKGWEGAGFGSSGVGGKGYGGSYQPGSASAAYEKGQRARMPHNVQSFPMLAAPLLGAEEEGGLVDDVVMGVEESNRHGEDHNSYRRAQSVQFSGKEGGSSQYGHIPRPAFVVDGAPMAPLGTGQRYVAMSKQEGRQTERQQQQQQQQGGSGQGKQRLTLSEMGMLRGAW